MGGGGGRGAETWILEWFGNMKLHNKTLGQSLLCKLHTNYKLPCQKMQQVWQQGKYSWNFSNWVVSNIIPAFTTAHTHVILGMVFRHKSMTTLSLNNFYKDYKINVFLLVYNILQTKTSKLFVCLLFQSIDHLTMCDIYNWGLVCVIAQWHVTEAGDSFLKHLSVNSKL